MSIIERAAELLGSAPQKPRKPAAGGEHASKPASDLIERAALELGRERSGVVDGGVAGDPRGKNWRTRPGGRTAHTLAIDRERLRRQSMIVPDDGRTAIAESFRRIKRQVLAKVASSAGGTPPANLVMVTSALPGEGKTFCSINLAISIAQEVDRTVLLVDADVAKSDVPRTLGFTAEKGLMDILLDRQADLSEVLWSTDIGRLSLLPVGIVHKHSTELLASEAMSALLHEMADRYRDRIIIFDSPPLLAASEAGALAGQMGQIVVVVEAGRTPETALREALARVDSNRITGLLLNKGQDQSHEYYGYGSYG